MDLLKDLVTKKINDALQKLGSTDNTLTIKLEYARDEKFGDYACTIAMDKRARESFAAINPEFKNPLKFAESIAQALRDQTDFKNNFDSVDVVKPGFINIRISASLLFSYTVLALREGEHYGHSRKENPRNIIFEYVSANPTGPLNIVSARAAALGDSCCNLLHASGENVLREYYVNDYGNQVNLLGWSCLLRYLEMKGVTLKFSEKKADGTAEYPAGEGIPFPSEGYHGEYLKDVVNSMLSENPEIKPDDGMVKNFREMSKNKTLKQEEILELKDASKAAEEFGIKTTQYFLETHRRDLELFRVNFNNFFSERSLHETDSVLNILGKLKDHLYTEDGKQLFRSTDFGDDKDRVVVRADGRPTYLLADIAYHHTKIKRGYTDIYNIWGPDHHGYIRRLAGAMEVMGFNPDHFRVMIAQQVNLLENGKPIVMSKRTGKFITMETLMEEIPVDVVRYFFVMRSFEAHLDFDFAEARDTSEKNPYYYVAYAHARIRSIFRKAHENKLLAADPDLRTSVAEELTGSIPPELTEERRRLLWLTARFPEEVRDAADNLEPHRIINYLYQLASSLSKFYAPAENKIISQDIESARPLLAMLDGVAHCLKNGLRLLGMEAPERMVREESA